MPAFRESLSNAIDLKWVDYSICTEYIFIITLWVYLNSPLILNSYSLMMTAIVSTLYNTTSQFGTQSENKGWRRMKRACVCVCVCVGGGGVFSAGKVSSYGHLFFLRVDCIANNILTLDSNPLLLKSECSQNGVIQCNDFPFMSWLLVLLDHQQPWASFQIRKIAGCACAGNAGNVFPATDLKGNH